MAELAAICVLFHGMLGSPAMCEPVLAALAQGGGTTGLGDRAGAAGHGLPPWGWSISASIRRSPLSPQLPPGPLCSSATRSALASRSRSRRTSRSAPR